MLEVISTRMQEIYSQWEYQREPSPGTEVPPRLSVSSLRRFGYQQRSQRRQVYKANIKKAQARQQNRIKQMPWDIFWGKMDRPLMGLCCNLCNPGSRGHLLSEATKAHNIRNVLLVDAQGSGNGFFTRKFCYLSTVWYLKKYDYPQLSSIILQDERLRQAIETAAKEDIGEEEEKNMELYTSLIKRHERRASRIVMQMRSTLSDILLRITSWVLYKLLPCFLTSVVTHPGQIEMLHKAGQSGLPLIFLPLHRSHLDYILISFILLNNNIKSPLVAAGDNLRIPVFGWLLRGLGAFFIKRRMDPVMGKRDVVYRAVLHTYMMECLRAGHNMEFFIEGGRSRTGKPSLPKGGLLSVIIDAYMDGTIQDALLVPVSINYEKLVDGNFVRELLGQPKQMETFGSAIRGICSVLTSNYGMMRIDFNQPFSLRELVQSFHVHCKNKLHVPAPLGGMGDSDDSVYSDNNSNSVPLGSTKHLHAVPSSASLFGTDFVDEEHRQLVESIARHIMFDATHSSAIMSTNAVAFLMLNRFREGVSLKQLVRAMDDLRRDLSNADKDLGFTGESIDVINHALELLGPGLVRRERRLQTVEGQAELESTVFITPVTMLPNVIELSYYSNGLLSFYAMDAVVVTALYALLRSDLDNLIGSEHTISHSSLLLNAYELCDILQFEFIFTRPCQYLESVIMDKIDNLKYKDILVHEEKEYTVEEQRSQRLARFLEEEDGYSSEEMEVLVRPVPDYVVNTDEGSVRHLQFHQGLIRPLMEIYTVSAQMLHRLVRREVPERELLQEILAEMKKQLDMGQALYEESLSVEPIRNSLKLFERWGVVECYTQDRIKLYYLKDTYDNDDSVRSVVEKIKKYKWLGSKTKD